MPMVEVQTAETGVRDRALRRLITRTRLRRRIKEMAVQIRGDYQESRPVLVGVLKGAFVFLADLIRALDIPLEVDFIQVSSYGSDTKSSGEITIGHHITADIAGRPVLLVEDIVDTGLTMDVIRRYLEERGAAEVRVCALLARRSALKAGARIDYLGFAIPEGFVVGYGLDYAQQYRYLPEIFVLEEA